MGYNEEQTNAYNSMLGNLAAFKELKLLLFKDKCAVHGKKLKMEANWEEGYNVEIIISKFCCDDFAEKMAKQFRIMERFDSVKMIK